MILEESRIEKIRLGIREARETAATMDVAAWNERAQFRDDLPHQFGYIEGRRRAPSLAAEGESRSSAPPNDRAVATLLARPAAIAEAEAAALEMARRLAPWGALPPTAIEWFVVDGPMRDMNDFGSAFSCAQWSVEDAVAEAGLPNTLDAVADDLPLLAQATLTALRNWERAVEAKLVVPSNHWPREAVKWKPFADLEDPFLPAVQLWSTGYVLEASFWEKDTVLRFYAPALS